MTRRRRDIKNTVVYVGPHAEKFDIVSNDHGCTHKCNFWGNSGPKYQNCQFKLKFGNLTNSNMQDSMVISFYSF